MGCSTPKKNFLRRPAGILTAAIFLTAAICFPFCRPPGSILIELVFISTVLSFSGMVGVWCGVGRHWSRYWIAAFPTLLTSVGMGLCFNWVGALIVVASTIPICVAIEFIKFMFGRFEIVNNLDDDREEGIRFGISHIMIFTAAVALFISLVQWLLSFAGSISGPGLTINMFLIVATIVSVIVFNTLTNTWALMGKRIGWKLAIAFGLAVLVIPFASLMAPDLHAYQMWIVFFAICWVSVALQLWLLRKEGIRFVRK